LLCVWQLQHMAIAFVVVAIGCGCLLSAVENVNVKGLKQKQNQTFNAVKSRSNIFIFHEQKF